MSNESIIFKAKNNSVGEEKFEIEVRDHDDKWLVLLSKWPYPVPVSLEKFNLPPNCEFLIADTVSNIICPQDKSITSDLIEVILKDFQKEEWELISAEFVPAEKLIKIEKEKFKSLFPESFK